MTTVRVLCPSCQSDLALEHTAFRLTLLDTGPASYEYFCTGCRQHIVRPADSRARSLLTLAHAPTRKIHVPAEYLEAKHGLPICADDIAAFDVSFEDWWSARHDSNVRHVG